MVAAAAQAIMDEPVGRFSPSFGGNNAPFGVLDPFNLQGIATLNIFPYPDVLCYRLVCVCCFGQWIWSLNREHTVQSRRSEYTRRWACWQPERGSNRTAPGHLPQTSSVGSRNGSVLRRVRPLLARGRLSTQAPRHFTQCERRRLSSSVAVAHVIHRHGYVRRWYCRAQVARFWRGDCRRCCFG